MTVLAGDQPVLEIHIPSNTVVQIADDQVQVIEVGGLPSAVIVDEDDADVIFVHEGGGVKGDKGDQGDQGPQGLEGPIGAVGPQGPYAPTETFNFASPSMQWVIVHTFDNPPVVSVYDQNGEEIGGTLSMPDRYTVVIDFAVPIAGSAILKA